MTSKAIIIASVEPDNEKRTAIEDPVFKYLPVPYSDSQSLNSLV